MPTLELLETIEKKIVAKDRRYASVVDQPSGLQVWGLAFIQWATRACPNNDLVANASTVVKRGSAFLSMVSSFQTLCFDLGEHHSELKLHCVETRAILVKSEKAHGYVRALQVGARRCRLELRKQLR